MQPTLIQIGSRVPGQADSCALPSGEGRRLAWLQGVTLTWMLVECGVALFAGYRSRSSALLAFGSDSFVELLSAGIVILQFVPAVRLGKALASRLAGYLLFALAAVVALTAIVSLVLKVQPESSWLGIGITAAALLVMPILAWSKRRMAKRINNRALAADAVQSATCAWLAAVTLGGLAIRALTGIAWIDAAAALCAIPFLLVEGRRALKGESCGCC
jgi:divalent metal cation (Fe/Co/Zn/Cd) transporter